MVQIKTKLSKGSGPMHSVKIGHHLDPCHTRIFRIFFDLSLNAPSHFCQKSPFIIASSLSVTPRLISCFWMSLGGFIKTCVFFSNVYPIITFFWGGGTGEGAGFKIHISKCLFNFFSQRNANLTCPKPKSFASFSFSPPLLWRRASLS